MAKPFADHFSGHSSVYAKFRPGYPQEVYDRILEFGGPDLKQKGIAVDIGCGSGQATKRLHDFFPKVFGIEPSPQQLEQAEQIDGIEYICARAEQTPLPAGEADLITVATAVHWFNLAEFWPEVDRILRPGGIIAIWTNGETVTTNNEKADLAYKKFNEKIFSYWAPQNHQVFDKYKDVHIPYERKERGYIYSKRSIPLFFFTGFLRTWSAYQSFMKDHPEEKILEELEEEIKIAYGLSSSEEKIEIDWEVILLLGQKPTN